MARIQVASGVTLPGYTYGTKFAVQANNAVASSRSIPLQPSRNSQAAANVMMAYTANFWNSLPTATQDQWWAAPQTRQDGLNLFTQWNINSLTWGMGTWDAPTFRAFFYPAPVVAWVSMDDRSTTLMELVIGGSVVPEYGLYVHLYTNWNAPPRSSTGKQPGYSYTLSVGPLTPEVVYYYDVTAIVNRYKGQWIDPGTADTPPAPGKGWALMQGYYISDQFGRIYDGGGGPVWGQLNGFYPQTVLGPPPYNLSPILHQPPWAGNQPT